MSFPVLTLSRLANAGLLVLLCAPLGIGLAALSGIGHRWVDILAQFTAAALVGALALTAVASVMRLWLAVGAGATTSLILLLAGWPQWAPPTGTPKPGAPVMTLYSANLHVRNRDVEAVRASVADSRADVVVLVETPRAMLGQLDRILPRQTYRVVETGGVYAIDGTVIASRWPVRKVEARSGGNHIAAVVETPLGEVTVFGVHLTRPWPYQYQWGQLTQVMALEASAKGISGPVVMAGDFNSVSSGRVGRTIRKDLGLIPAPGWPGTWPSSLPSAVGMNIDQVYHSPDLAVTGRRLGRPSGSDHRPVVTRLTLSEPRPRP
ncbi:endonuclease/exonuclease/phosphatase family protein [soil metagenome]